MDPISAHSSHQPLGRQGDCMRLIPKQPKTRGGPDERQRQGTNETHKIKTRQKAKTKTYDKTRQIQKDNQATKTSKTKRKAKQKAYPNSSFEAKRWMNSEGSMRGILRFNSRVSFRKQEPRTYTYKTREDK